MTKELNKYKQAIEAGNIPAARSIEQRILKFVIRIEDFQSRDRIMEILTLYSI